MLQHLVFVFRNDICGSASLVLHLSAGFFATSCHTQKEKPYTLSVENLYGMVLLTGKLPGWKTIISEILPGK